MADELKKRSGGFAEGMVVMACPVLVAIALGKVDLKVYGHHALFAMLAMAGITLIIGICPFLVCWFSRIFPGFNPVPVTAILATISSCSLLILACFIAQFVVSKEYLIAVGVLSGFLILLHTVLYYRQENFDLYPAETGMDKILNQSLEFLTGVTGVLFLGLEGLALQGHDNPMFEKGGAVAVASFILCAAGVCMMYLEMTPPTGFTRERQIVHLTLWLDSFMAVGTLGLLTTVVRNSLGLVALTLLAPPFAIFLVLLFLVAIDCRRHISVSDIENSSAVQAAQVSAPTVQVVQVSAPAVPVSPSAVQAVQGSAPDFQVSAPAMPMSAPAVQAVQVSAPDVQVSEPDVQAVQLSAPAVLVSPPAVQDVQLPAPASLELTRVTFAGFLAVSITVISNPSPSQLTGYFLLFAAAAIVFGLSWRLLSQTHVRSSLASVSPDHFDSSANLASLGTHVCIVIATVLLLVMACIATENNAK